jgi:hypothetical protein
LSQAGSRRRKVSLRRKSKCKPLWKEEGQEGRRNTGWSTKREGEAGGGNTGRDTELAGGGQMARVL